MVNRDLRWAVAATLCGFLTFWDPILATITVASTPVTALKATATSITTLSSPQPGPVTTAPVFLPYYDEESWSAVRGSVITKDASANKTTYTIFCPTQTTNACNLAIEFPFILVEGPETVEFHGTYTSTFIADIECILHERTAATCSGYSSLASGYTMGHESGPTELSWTSTFSGTSAEWGVLTLTNVPTLTEGSPDATGNGATVELSNTALLYLPSETSEGYGTFQRQGTKRFALVLALSTLIGYGLL